MRKLFAALLFIAAIAGLSAQPVNVNRFYPATSNQERWKAIQNLQKLPDTNAADSLLHIASDELERDIDPEGALMQISTLIYSSRETRLSELDRAEELFKRHNDTLCYAYACFLYKKGFILRNMRQYDRMTDVFQRAGNVLKLAEPEHEALPEYYLQIMNSNMFFKRIPESINAFNQLRNLAERKKNYYYLSLAYRCTGDLLKFYDPPVAELFFDYTQYIVSGHVRESEENPYYYLSLGTGKTACDKYGQALAFYLKGLTKLFNDKNRMAQDEFNRGLFHYYAGVSYKALKQFDKAIAHLDTAAMYEPPKQRDYYRAIQMKAVALDEAGRSGEALPLLRETVDFYIKNLGTDNTLYTQIAIHQLSMAERHQGNFNEALTWVHKSICYFMGSSDTLDAYKVPKVSHLITPEKNYKELEFFVYEKIDVLKDMFTASRDTALIPFIMSHFGFMMEIADVNALASQTQQALLKISERYKDASNKLLDFISEENLPPVYQEEAYRLIARSKAFSILVKSMVDAHACNISESIETAQKQQQKKRVYEKLEFITPSDTAAYMPLMAELIDLEKEEFLARYINPVKDEKLILPNLISTSEMNVRKGIGNNDVVIDYYVSENTLHTFIITNDAFNFYSQTLTKSFNSDMEQLNRAIKTNDTKKVKELTEYLSTLLLKNLPVGNGRKLVIIPDEKLFVIPFDLLLHNGNLLLAGNSIEYRYSSHLFRSDTERPDTYSLVAYAPVFDNEQLAHVPEALRGIDTEDIEENILREGTGKYNPIPASSQEVTAIGKLFADRGLSCGLYLREQSTKQHVQQFIDRGNILHIATHGFSNKNNPGISGLAFASEKNSNKFESCYLSLTEISNLKLSMDLVVLSACKSGYGTIVRGEGIMGLSRGFIAAGAKNVIASLWKIHDEKTKELMVAFYHHLLEDNTTYAEALRSAKLDCIAKGYLPMDWAGFILIGN